MDLAVVTYLFEHYIIFVKYSEITQKFSWKSFSWWLLHLVIIYRFQQRNIMLRLETGNIPILKLDFSPTKLANDCLAQPLRSQALAFFAPKDIPFDA
jgi:hypothetical protein